MTIAGLERELPICPLNEKVCIAGFVMFSDVELTIACAQKNSSRNAEILMLFLPLNQKVFRLLMKCQDNAESLMLLQENLLNYI